MKDLENLFLLKGLPIEEKKEIIEHLGSVKCFKKGDVIYSKDRFSNAIGYIVKGKATAVTDNNDNIHLRTFEKSACFGAAAIFGGSEHYISTITAKTDVEILFITEKVLKEIFLKYPETSTNYIEFLSDKIRFLNTKLNVISCQSADDTVLKHLLGNIDKNNTVTLKSMTLLASGLGLSRATLYRSLDSLQEKGIILRENNKVKVIKNEKTD